MALTLTDRATMDEIVSWQDSFLSEHSGRNLQRQPEHINTMMRTYLGKMRSNMATILKAMPPLANKLARKISVIVHFFYQCRTNYGNHNLWEFLDHMTEVLAFYCDIRIHGFMVYNERAVDVSHGILTMLKLYLEENHVSIVNVLIRMTRHRHSKTIFEQIFQDVEKDAPLAQSRRSPITYCRYLLFYRQWKRMYKELHILQKMSLQASEKLKVPPGFRAHPLFDLIKPGPIVPPNITLYLLSTNIRTNEAAEKFFGYLKARNMMDESDLICESEEVLEVIDLTDEPGSPPKEEIEDVEEVYDLVPEVCSVETMTNQFQETVTTAGGESSSSAQVVPIISTLNEGEIVIADSENMAPISKEPQQTRPQDTDSIDAGYSDRSVSDLCENSPSYEIEPHEGQAACPNYWHKPPVAQANVEKIPSHVDAATSCSTNETLGGIPKSHCSETPPNAPVQNADNVGFPNSTVIQPTLNQKTTATSTTQTVDIDEGISPMEVETASSAVESVVNSDMVSATDDTHRQKMTQTADASRISEIVPKPAEVLPTTPTVPIQQINLSSIPCCSCGGEKSKSVETVSSVMTEIFTKLNTDTTLSENNSANSNPEIYTLKTKEPITNSKHIPGESLITDVISDNVNVEVSSQVHNSEPVDNIFNQGSGAVATEEQCPKIAPQSDSISASLPINNSVLQSVVNEEPTPAAATSPLRNTPSPTDQLFIDCVLSNDIERSNKPRENLKRVDQISYATPKSVSASPQKYTDFCGFRNNQVLYASSDPDMHSQSSHNCTVHLSAITAKAQQTRAYLENSSKRMVVTRPYEQFTGTIEDGYGRKIKIKPILKTNRNPIKNVAKKVNITGEVLQKNIFVEEEQPIVYDTMLTSTTGKEYKFNSRINRIEKHRSLISMQNYYPKTSRETTEEHGENEDKILYKFEHTERRRTRSQSRERSTTTNYPETLQQRGSVGYRRYSASTEVEPNRTPPSRTSRPRSPVTEWSRAIDYVTQAQKPMSGRRRTSTQTVPTRRSSRSRSPQSDWSQYYAKTPPPEPNRGRATRRSSKSRSPINDPEILYQKLRNKFKILEEVKILLKREDLRQKKLNMERKAARLLEERKKEANRKQEAYISKKKKAVERLKQKKREESPINNLVSTTVESTSKRVRKSDRIQHIQESQPLGNRRRTRSHSQQNTPSQIEPPRELHEWVTTVNYLAGTPTRIPTLPEFMAMQNEFQNAGSLGVKYNSNITSTLDSSVASVSESIDNKITEVSSTTEDQLLLPAFDNSSDDRVCTTNINIFDELKSSADCSSSCDDTLFNFEAQNDSHETSNLRKRFNSIRHRTTVRSESSNNSNQSSTPKVSSSIEDKLPNSSQSGEINSNSNPSSISSVQITQSDKLSTSTEITESESLSSDSNQNSKSNDDVKRSNSSSKTIDNSSVRSSNIRKNSLFSTINSDYVSSINLKRTDSKRTFNSKPKQDSRNNVDTPKESSVDENTLHVSTLSKESVVQDVENSQPTEKQNIQSDIKSGSSNEAVVEQSSLSSYKRILPIKKTSSLLEKCTKKLKFELASYKPTTSSDENSTTTASTDGTNRPLRKRRNSNRIFSTEGSTSRLSRKAAYLKSFRHVTGDPSSDEGETNANSQTPERPSSETTSEESLTPPNNCIVKPTVNLNTTVNTPVTSTKILFLEKEAQLDLIRPGTPGKKVKTESLQSDTKPIKTLDKSLSKSSSIAKKCLDSNIDPLNDSSLAIVKKYLDLNIESINTDDSSVAKLLMESTQKGEIKQDDRLKSVITPSDVMLGKSSKDKSNLLETDDIQTKIKNIPISSVESPSTSKVQFLENDAIMDVSTPHAVKKIKIEKLTPAPTQISINQLIPEILPPETLNQDLVALDPVLTQKKVKSSKKKVVSKSKNREKIKKITTAIAEEKPTVEIIVAKSKPKPRKVPVKQPTRKAKTKLGKANDSLPVIDSLPTMDISSTIDSLPTSNTSPTIDSLPTMDTSPTIDSWPIIEITPTIESAPNVIAESIPMVDPGHVTNVIPLEETVPEENVTICANLIPATTESDVLPEILFSKEIPIEHDESEKTTEDNAVLPVPSTKDERVIDTIAETIERVVAVQHVTGENELDDDLVPLITFRKQKRKDVDIAIVPKKRKRPQPAPKTVPSKKSILDASTAIMEKSLDKLVDIQVLPITATPLPLVPDAVPSSSTAMDTIIPYINSEISIISIPTVSEPYPEVDNVEVEVRKEKRTSKRLFNSIDKKCEATANLSKTINHLTKNISAGKMLKNKVIRPTFQNCVANNKIMKKNYHTLLNSKKITNKTKASKANGDNAKRVPISEERAKADSDIFNLEIIPYRDSDSPSTSKPNTATKKAAPEIDVQDPLKKGKRKKKKVVTFEDSFSSFLEQPPPTDPFLNISNEHLNKYKKEQDFRNARPEKKKIKIVKKPEKEKCDISIVSWEEVIGEGTVEDLSIEEAIEILNSNKSSSTSAEGTGVINWTP